MPVMHDKIIVENVIEEILKHLPQINGFDHHFLAGSDYELKKYLATVKKPYPLIWLLYPMMESYSRTKIEIENISFIIAVNTSIQAFNAERMQESYAKILMPLFSDFVKLMRRNNVLTVTSDIHLTKFPNYSDDIITALENKSRDRWDAIKIMFNCNIIDNCLKVKI